MAQYRIYYNHTGHCNHTGIFFFHITQSDPANIALIYILALIIIARITTGYFFGIISAFFCVIFINWCFTYPYFEVSFAISGYPVTFVFLLTISMIVSTLTTRLKTG